MRRDLLLALLAGLIAGAVYAFGAAPGVLFGDSGELQFAAWTAGLPHPTGYPLYMTIGWAWSHLLVAFGLATPARAMTLLSVLFAAAAVGLTFLFTRYLVGLSLPRTPVAIQRVAALLAAMTFAFAPTFWSQAVITEVYTLHAAFVALILALAILWGRAVEDGEWGGGSVRSKRSVPGSLENDSAASSTLHPLLFLLALTFGLSLAHHRTTLLLAPFVVGYLAWQAPRGYWRLHRRNILWLFLLALAPLVLYLYVPLRADATPYLTVELQPGQPTSLLDRSSAGLLAYLLGRGFAGELQAPASALAAAPGLVGRLAAELTPIGAALALLGLVILVARRRWNLLWLTGGSFLALAAFNLVYTIGDIAVFYIPCYLIACAWIGVAATWLADLVYSRVFRRRPSQDDYTGTSPAASNTPSVPSQFVVPFVVISLLLPAYLFFTQSPALDRRDDTRAQDWWNALLAANPPQGAMLISNDRDEMMPLWYMQQVDGTRPDLAGVFPLLLPGEGWETVGQVVDSALATGRPTSLVKSMPGLEIKARLGASDPSGLTPVLGPAITGPPARPQDVGFGDTIRLAGDTVEPAAIQPGQTLTVDLLWQAVSSSPADYTSFVQLLLPDGTKVVQSDHLVGDVYYPSSLWQPGETLLDRHTLNIPVDAPQGPYQLFVGLYELVGDEVRPVGGTVLDGPDD